VTVGDIVTLLGGAGGGIGVIMLALFISGVIVPKSRVDDMKEERDEWRRKSEVDQAISQALLEVAGVTKDTLASLRKELGK